MIVRLPRRAGLVLITLMMACTGDSAHVSPTPAVASIPHGGTLRVVTTGFFPDTLDPKEWSQQTWEIMRCCLLRTLLSYDGRPTDQGGTVLRPDLTTAMPTVSSDGLTWTFHIKAGLHYAPPLAGTEIVAQDFERALLRAADPHANPSHYFGTYSSYYSVIQGFADVAHGRAQTISGLSTPDDHTLVIRLTRPTGDLGYRLALAAAAPIPGNPSDPAAPLGVAQGHDDGYAPYLVSSGPYMIEGSGDLDLSQAPASQTPVTGLRPFRLTRTEMSPGELTLVRNPSWVAATDPLRPAYPDRIEVQVGWRQPIPAPPYAPIGARLFQGVLDGRWDTVMGDSPPLRLLDRASSDPALASQMHTEQGLSMNYVAMNLAVPPFDDVHVRRAFSLALDKAQLIRRAGLIRQVTPAFRGVVARHLAPDGLEESLLASWRPSWDVASDTGDVAAARAQMRQSAYDRDGDGRCDGSVCDRAVFAVDNVYPAILFPPIRAALEAIGIRFNLRRFPRGHGPLPTGHFALMADRWGNDFPSGSAFFPQVFSSASFTSAYPADMDPSLLGVSAAQLRAWGYSVTSVPSADAAIARCEGLVGTQQVQCWTALDQDLMENVVPWVPFSFQVGVRMVSTRVVNYSFDQFTGEPALDQLAIRSG